MQHYSTEILSDYIEGLLNPEVNEDIRTHLNDCERCRLVAEGIRHLMIAGDMKRDEADTYLNGLEEKFRKEITRDENNDTGRIRKWFPLSPVGKVAALILLIIVPAVLLFVLFQKSGTKDIISLYLEEPYQAPVFLREQGNAGYEFTPEFIESYMAKEYEKAALILEQKIGSGKAVAAQYFYLGLCYLYTGSDTGKSIDALLKVTETTSRYHEQAEWYLALAYYIDRDYNKAGIILREISENPSHFKHGEAKGLLRDISDKK